VIAREYVRFIYLTAPRVARLRSSCIPALTRCTAPHCREKLFVNDHIEQMTSLRQQLAQMSAWCECVV
jgi:hypothetical protein